VIYGCICLSFSLSVRAALLVWYGYLTIIEQVNMIKSMTAFARQEVETTAGLLGWELRSVNHRYAEISLRLPEDLRALEPQLREAIGARVKRGKVDATLRLRPRADVTEAVTINTEQARAVLQACVEIEGLMDNPDRINALDILRWPGVLQSATIDLSQVKDEVLALLERALDELLETRAREGGKIVDLLRQRCQAIAAQISSVRENLPDILVAQRQRLLRRLDELRGDLDSDRLEQEVAYIAQKIDVEEELDRLDVHLAEMERILQQAEPNGRRLDFLMQEFNREVNTLASKSVAGVTTQAAVEMKVLVEQMREQIQNVE
jgi:uncharacterized protein (TIGR00255 family)